MKAVVIGQPSGVSMSRVIEVYPRHKAFLDEFVLRGEVIGVGPFSDFGNMAIFRTRSAAEAFVRHDPFLVEGVITSYVIREWGDTMLV